MIYLSRKFKLEVSHHLPSYVGPCRRKHGHSLTVEVIISGKKDAKTGMVIDFKELKEACNKAVDLLDHRDLNKFIPNPTAENLIDFIAPIIIGSLPLRVKLEGIKVWETENNCCLIRYD